MSWFEKQLSVYHRNNAIAEPEVFDEMALSNPFVGMVGDLEEFKPIRIKPLGPTAPIIEVVDVSTDPERDVSS